MTETGFKPWPNGSVVGVLHHLLFTLKIEEDDSKDQRQLCSIIFYGTGIVLGRIEQDGKFQ